MNYWCITWDLLYTWRLSWIFRNFHEILEFSKFFDYFTIDHVWPQMTPQPSGIRTLTRRLRRSFEVIQSSLKNYLYMKIRSFTGGSLEIFFHNFRKTINNSLICNPLYKNLMTVRRFMVNRIKLRNIDYVTLKWVAIMNFISRCSSHGTSLYATLCTFWTFGTLGTRVIWILIMKSFLT